MRCSCILLTLLVACRNVKSFQVPPSFQAKTTKQLQATTEEVEDKDVAALRSMTFSNLSEEQEPQLLCNFLMELGACSTSIIDADRGTCNETPLFDEFDAESMTRTAVTTHVWDNCHVSAHFPASTDLQWIMDIVQETFEDLPKYKVTNVENKDWVLHVQQSW